MKQKLSRLLSAAAVVVLATSGYADVYTDATGDLNDGTVGDNFSIHTHLDITSVEVTNSNSDLIFKINLAGNPVSVDWGKYCIGIDTNDATGDVGEFGNGWGRHITMSPRGMDFWVGSWVDGGSGAELWWHDPAGPVWSNIGGASVSKTTSNVTLTIPFAKLGKAFGDTVQFDVYSTAGGGTDPAVDALNDPNPTVTAWTGIGYTNNVVSSYTLQTVLTVPHYVTFLVDMGVPIWEFDNAVGDGFSTNNGDVVYVRGTFNEWGGSDAMLQVGSTLFSNTITFDAVPGSTIQYKFEGYSFPGYENPLLLNGANRTLELTNTTMTAPLAFFGDRSLTNPPVSIVQMEVDMSLQRQFGEFNPEAGDTVSLPGGFNEWSTTGLILAQGADPDTNIFSGTITYNYYPTGAMTVDYFKFKLNTTTGTPRNSGWENPISTSNGNRSFALLSANNTNRYFFNDENGIFPVDTVEKLDADSAKLTFKAYAEGIYEIESRSSFATGWAVIGSVTNSSHDYKSVSFTQTGLTGADAQFYRARFTGYDKPPLP